MQPITRIMGEAIRSSYQAPIAKFEIYNKDGSLAGTILDVEDVEVNVAGSRKVLRAFSAKLNNDDGQYSPDPDQFDRNFLWYNKTIKIFYGFHVDQGQIRYVRDWLNGSTANTSNHWVELQALDFNGVNKAAGKTPTSNQGLTSPSYLTDGSTNTANYTGASPGSTYVQIDLGALYDIENVKVWHYYGDARTYHGAKTEVSADGVHWIPLYDSAIQGEYKETAAGMTFMVHDQWLPQGVFTIDYIKPEVRPDGITLEIGGQDLSSKMIEDKFDDTYKVEDLAATESANYATSGTASASSNVVTGDEIQTQARIYYVDTFANINGLLTKVNNQNTAASADPKRIIDGTTGAGWLFNYTAAGGETVSFIEAEIFVDLQTAEDLNNITINIGTGALTDFVYYSPDNQTWTSIASTNFDPAGLVRYIKFKVRQSTINAGVWSLSVTEVQIKTINNFPPANAIDSDVYVTHWRPKALTVDPNPTFTLDLGSSKSINVLYLYWGNNSFDFWNRVNYFLEWSTNGSTWTRITDLNGLDETDSLFGDVEHVFTAITARYIKINIKGRDGVTKLRHVKAQSITSTQTIDKVIKDVAATSGITNVIIPVTRRYVKSKQADIGDEKISFCSSVAGSVGWVDLYWDENGVLRTGPRNINPVDLAWTFDVGTDNIFSFSPRFSNDIYNVILVIGKGSSDKAILGKAQDTDPLSPTYIGTLGRRVIKYEGDSYNTQDKVDQIAAQRLFERTRFKHQTELPVTGHPGLQHDDVIRVNVPEAKVEDSLYVITGFVTKLSADSAEFNSTINISQIREGGS